MNSGKETERTIGLWGATGVGIGAIVGGGILALAGTAFAATGPAAMLAFGINGLIAMLTALSFAEMASKFPESGGTYIYAKKVLSIEAAFTVGWVVWFASIVAAVLYALGFAFFALEMADRLWRVVAGSPPAWLTAPAMVSSLALITTVLLGIGLTRSAAGGGNWANVGKVIVFLILIACGIWAVARQSPATTSDALQPFFTAGFGGLIQAMGYTFIALQGFDLIAAIGGEVREPSRTIPRAMILSLAVALAIYLPLLFVVATVGTPAGESISKLAQKDPEGIIAIAAQNYLGPFGYWLVIVAAILSMFSALQANLLAASRIARTMARAGTLPIRMSILSVKRRTPVVAVTVTTCVVAVILLVIPDVSAAGAATSLIFLINFAVAHWLSILIRQRSQTQPPPFRLPYFPVVQVVGGSACLCLAIYQGTAVPLAGVITVVWLSAGGILFLALFARRAHVRDASSRAFNPELMTLRGRSPLVLVPVANPENAEALIAFADALVPASIGRVLVQTVIVAPAGWQPETDHSPIDNLPKVLNELFRASAKIGIQTEVLVTVAPQPMSEIERVAELHRCESVLLGFSEISSGEQAESLETLIGNLDSDVVVLRSQKDWQFRDAQKILVPVAGRGGHEKLMALLLGSLMRRQQREVTFLQVLSPDARPREARRARREMRRLAVDILRRRCEVVVVKSDDALGTVAEWAERSDLVVLGVQRIGRRRKLFGEFTRQLVQRTVRPVVVISSRG